MKRLGIMLVFSALLFPAGPAWADHDWDHGWDERERCYDSDCGGRGDSGDDWNSEQRNHNRRNRGAFSPGPFDRSPVEMHDVCISLDCSGRDKERRGGQEGSDGRGPGGAESRSLRPASVGCLVPVPWHCDPKPAALFPPTPDGIKAFVLSTIRGGIEMGRLFAETTIRFVENLLVGIA